MKFKVIKSFSKPGNCSDFEVTAHTPYAHEHAWAHARVFACACVSRGGGGELELGILDIQFSYSERR